MAGSMAWATYDYVFQAIRNGELDEQDRGRCTSVLRKEPSGWLIQHEHCSKTKPQGMERLWMSRTESAHSPGRKCMKYRGASDPVMLLEEIITKQRCQFCLSNDAFPGEKQLAFGKKMR